MFGEVFEKIAGNIVILLAEEDGNPGAMHATGPPLGAECDDRRYKLLMVDIGLVSASLGVSLTDLDRGADLVMANEA